METDLQQTFGGAGVGTRVDFNQEAFDTLVGQKGQSVTVESALQCPCKSEATNQLSSCRNCGGSGWVFVDKRPARIVLSAISIMNEYKDWSEQARGTVNITAPDNVELAFMDRITLVEGKSLFNEVLHFKSHSGEVFAFTTYKIETLKYIAMFQSDKLPLKILVENEDFVIDGYIIKLIGSKYVSAETDELSATLRYSHKPVFHVLELKREAMQTPVLTRGKERLATMPISAMGRRAHYMIDKMKLDGTGLIDNPLAKIGKCKCECEKVVEFLLKDGDRLPRTNIQMLKVTLTLNNGDVETFTFNTNLSQAALVKQLNEQLQLRGLPGAFFTKGGKVMFSDIKDQFTEGEVMAIYETKQEIFKLQEPEDTLSKPSISIPVASHIIQHDVLKGDIEVMQLHVGNIFNEPIDPAEGKGWAHDPVVGSLTFPEDNYPTNVYLYVITKTSPFQ